jgi:hypothetical protein
MIRAWFVLLFVAFFLIGCSALQQQAGTYDEKGNYIPAAAVESTYGLPDIGAGIVVSNKGVMPIFSAEVFDTELPYITSTCGDFFFGENTFGVMLSHRWTSIFEVKTGAWFGYESENALPGEKSPVWLWGVGILISKF